MESLDEGGFAPYADGALVEEGCSAAAGDSLCAATTEAVACSVSPTGSSPREVPPRHRVSFTFSPFRPKHGSPAVRTLATPSSPMHLVEVADGSLENAPEVPASAHSCGNELVHPTPADDGERIQPATTARRLEQRLPLQAQRPNFSSAGWAPLGEVFVHGSGECDQLGWANTCLSDASQRFLLLCQGCQSTPSLVEACTPCVSQRTERFTLGVVGTMAPSGDVVLMANHVRPSFLDM